MAGEVFAMSMSPRDIAILKWPFAGGIAAILIAGLMEPALASEAPIDSNRAWHGRLMVAAWAVLFPVGILAARYLKVLPNQNWPQKLDNQFWWHMHRVTQYSGFVLMLIAMWLIWTAQLDAGRSLLFHRWAGWILVFAVVVQVLGCLLRGSKGGPTEPSANGSMFGDHYNMTPRRKAFEAVHKTVGYGSMILAIFALFSGLYAAAAPLWMWLANSAWLVSLGFVWLALEKKLDNRVSTYQAIWGANPEHPGNGEVT